MGFRLLPKSVTLNDLERRYGPLRPIFEAYYVKLTKARPVLSAIHSVAEEL